MSSSATTLSSGDIAHLTHGSSSDSCSEDASDFSVPISLPHERTPVAPILPLDFHAGLVAMCQAILHAEGITVEDMPWFGLNCWEHGVDERDPIWFFYAPTPKSRDRDEMNVAWRGINALFRSSQILVWRADRVVGCKCRCEHKELSYGDGICVAELAWMIRKCVDLRRARRCVDMFPSSIIGFLRQFPEGHDLAQRLHAEWRIVRDEKARKAALREAQRASRKKRCS